MLALCVVAILIGCVSSEGTSNEYNTIRRVTIINCRTDKVLVEVIAQCNVDKYTKAVIITSEIGNGTYQTDYFTINDWTTYCVEDLCGAYVSPYIYEINYFPDNITPFNFDVSR